MELSKIVGPTTGTSSGTTSTSGNEFLHEGKLLESFYAIPTIDKAWTCTTREGGTSLDVVVAMSQINVIANSRRSFMSSVYIPDAAKNPVDHHWSPFPFELSGASLVVPSPSGSKLLVFRKANTGVKDGFSTTKLEIWGPGQLLKEICVPNNVHGSVYMDGWFEGVSWNQTEDSIAYIAEECPHPRPLFGQDQLTSPYDGKLSSEDFAGTWKGQGDWLEDWGEYYTGKRRPVIFVVNLSSGIVQEVNGVPTNLSVGQVVWAPVPPPGYPLLDGPEQCKPAFDLSMWSFALQASTLWVLTNVLARSGDNSTQQQPCWSVKLTDEVNSALSPCFSPDGSLLVFLSAKAAVDSGVHCATNSLHFLHWPTHGVFGVHRLQVKDVVPVVMRPEAGCFPGLYCLNLISHPWLPDGSTLLLSSCWRSTQVLLAINIDSGKVIRISPTDSTASWTLLAVHNNYVVAAVSAPTMPHTLKLGYNPNITKKLEINKAWNWTDISIPCLRYADHVEASLASSTYEILQIPIPSLRSDILLEKGSKEPFEAIFVSAKSGKKIGNRQRGSPAPLILVLHGGPHSVSQTSFSRTAAFLRAMGFNLLHVNYRGSLGFGEESLQSLPGNVGNQDVKDVLAALDQVIAEGLVDPERVVVLGGSHGGFIASHLIGQAPERFKAAALRNPVCNMSSMVGVTDIPDWCYVELYGKDGIQSYTEAPTDNDLSQFYASSPIAHINNVKVPTLFLLGAEDRRVPISNGFQYVQALRQRGLEVKVIVFPDDIHSIDRPQSEFESYVNIATWFKQFL